MLVPRYQPTVDFVLDQGGKRSARYVLLRRSRPLETMWAEELVRVALVILDLESGCEAALLVGQRAGVPRAACARLAPGGERMRVAAAGEGYVCVWDVELAALRSNPLGPLPVLYPARRIAEVKHELFDGCLVDARTSGSRELGAVLLEKGARFVEEAQGTTAAAAAAAAADAAVGAAAGVVAEGAEAPGPVLPALPA
eukprot:tig00021178_g19199.t1